MSHKNCPHKWYLFPVRGNRWSRLVHRHRHILTANPFIIFNFSILDLFTAEGLHQTPSQTNSHESTSDGNSDNGGNSSGDEDSQLRLRLKRKLQRNRTSFTNEQIDSLEKGMSQLPTSSPTAAPKRPKFQIVACFILSFFDRIRTHTLSWCIC